MIIVIVSIAAGVASTLLVQKLLKKKESAIVADKAAVADAVKTIEKSI